MLSVEAAVVGAGCFFPTQILIRNWMISHEPSWLGCSPSSFSGCFGCFIIHANPC